MKQICLILAFVAAGSAFAAEKPVKKTTPKVLQKATPTKAPEATAPTKDWSLVECGKDLKTTFQNIEAYQKRLVKVADPLPLRTRQDLYSGVSVFAESLTLMSPQVFWKDIIASRYSSSCHKRFNALKKSMSTNDSKGVDARLKEWNQCVLSLYGALPKQTQQINTCVKQGVANIQSHQKKSKKK